MHPPTTTQLFYDLFEDNWPDDDPDFLEELRKYRESISRLLSIDNQLTHLIRTQPLYDNDHLSSIPITIGMHRATISASFTQSTSLGEKSSFEMICIPGQFNKIFSSITVDFEPTPSGRKQFQYLSTDTPTDSLHAQFDYQDPSHPITIKCEWLAPILQITSPALQKFMCNSKYTFLTDITEKLLQFIESRQLYNKGEVRCDAFLKNIIGEDSFHIDNIDVIISKLTQPIKPLIFELFPNTHREFVIQIPVFSDSEMVEFSPIKIKDPPINDFLMTALESKEQILALEEFSSFPKEFVDNMLMKETRSQTYPEMIQSSYYFQNPWVLDAATDYIKGTMRPLLHHPDQKPMDSRRAKPN